MLRAVSTYSGEIELHRLTLNELEPLGSIRVRGMLIGPVAGGQQLPLRVSPPPGRLTLETGAE